MEVIKFITYNESENYPENPIGGLGGFFKDGMRWNDYKFQFHQEHHETLENLRQSIIDNEIRCTGEQHQYSDYESCPVFEDETCATYSYRAWGDLMAAVWSTHENRDYNYMDFYM